MVLVLDWKLVATLGTVVEMSIMSMKESWLRRRCMGVWSLGSTQMRCIRVAIPIRAMEKRVAIVGK